MKTTLLSSFAILLVLTIVQTSQAQVLSYDHITYEADVKVEETPRAVLQERAWEWCASRYKVAKEVSRKTRKASERISINAWNNIYLPSSLGPQAVKMFYVLEINTDDNQVSLQITDIHYETYPDKLATNGPVSFTSEMLFGNKSYNLRQENFELVVKYEDASNAYFEQLLNSLRFGVSRNGLVAKK
jgi:hypothetical protein